MSEKNKIFILIAVILVLVMIGIYKIAEGEMVYTGVVPENHSFMDVIRYIYHGLF
ncbi:hypothetical protein [Bacillus toyonensis]|uniref:hypothetical protein n=1 Tax=Bacillus toyonensis TaxID=155322 RepID=UPI003302C48B|nr:hypothetical protein [Bacillus toyonensis]